MDEFIERVESGQGDVHFLQETQRAFGNEFAGEKP
jgi:hypothetical protein